MDGMARPCGVDIPDAEGSQHAHVGILQNAEESVKPPGAVQAAGMNSERDGICEKGVRGECARHVRNARQLGPLTLQVHRGLSVSLFSPRGRFPLFSCAAAIVKRIVPIRLISLTCSPTWISTLYRPGFHAPCGGESAR